MINSQFYKQWLTESIRRWSFVHSLIKRHLETS